MFPWVTILPFDRFPMLIWQKPLASLKRLGRLPRAFSRTVSAGGREVAGSQQPPFSESIVLQGKHSYGLEHIRVFHCGEGFKILVGSFNSIAPNQLFFLGGNHRVDWVTTYPFGHLNRDLFPSGDVHGRSGHPVSRGNIVIKNDVWIGYGCTLMSGITLGNGSVIAAGSLVTKDVPDYTIVGGNPARVIRYRFDPEIIQLLLDSAWWDQPDSVIDAIVPDLQSAASIEDIKRVVRTIQEKRQLSLHPN